MSASPAGKASRACARGTALALLALLALLGSGCSGKDASVPAASAGGAGAAGARSAGSVAKVHVAPARPAQGNETSFQTFLEAEREAELVAETDGEIVALRVREGQRVREGDTLLVIDDRDERLALRRDQAELAWSRSQVERTQRLSKDGHVSVTEVEQAKLQLDKAEAAVGISQVALSRCAVRAPIAGLVWMVRAEPHHRVSVGQPLLRVTNPDRLRASAYLPASMRGRVRAGSRVRLEPARGGEAIEAEVSRVDPLTDPASGTFKAVARFRRLPSHPEAGSEVRFVVPGPADEAALLLPMNTILLADGDSTWVWRCDGDRVRRSPVLLGPTRRDGFEIVSGLPSGARVVTGSDRPLRDGAVVEVVDAR
ncbi:MAG TPA: efflux RND transporter periplasmic adaptor subunit [Candidatus Eisenbacteria bacterium]|nr:efflux RND transporter periplasmic adaptor subunit [Candidatus Eisenbacteria bacterium]